MKPDKCPHCGAKIVRYKHAINVWLVKALRQLASCGGTANIAEIGLTHNQVCNFQKLKYWGLVEKGDDDGTWTVTERGYAFLAGEEEIPKQAITFRGQTENHEGEMVKVLDYLSSAWTRRVEYAENAIGRSDENGRLF
jgi:hypothetical protein